MIFLRWFLSALLFLAIARYVPGIFVASVYTALLLAFFWGIVTHTLRPILLFLTLPVTILSLGLFMFVINALLFWFLSTFIKGFEVSDFGTAFLGALLLSLGNSLIAFLLKKSSR
jgi:putative membrane protein